MNLTHRPIVRLTSLLVWMLLAGCATQWTAPEPIDLPASLQDLRSDTVDDVSVSAAFLTDEQARAHFGVDFAEYSLQLLWLSVRNASEQRLWYIRNVTDPDFYPADEAAWVLKNDVPDDRFETFRQRLRDESMRVMIPPHTVSEGFVILPRSEGGRYVEIRLAVDVMQKKAFDELRFGFALPLSDGIFDYEVLEVETAYAGKSLPDLNQDELRQKLASLPCCVSNADQDDLGDPINLVLVGTSHEVLNTLSRAGWSFTHRITFESLRREVQAALSGEEYSVAPVSSLFLFGRKQDFALQRARLSISQRNHLRLWLAPFRFEGQEVWIGQVSRDIGIKLTTKSPSLTTHVIDPDVDLAREYLLHSLIAEGLVDRFGFVEGSRQATRLEPAANLTDDPFFSDGLRLVVVLSVDPKPYSEVTTLGWRSSAAPVAEAQSEASLENVRPIETPEESPN